MIKKIVVVANNSGGLYGFRKELLYSFVKKGVEVVCLTPFDDDVDNLKKIGVKLIETPIDRRGLNPIKDILLFFKYLRLIKKEKPDLVVTYTIKPNIYASIASKLLHIEYANNITGLGTAFQNDGLLKKLVVALYKMSFSKSKVVFFENIENLNTIVDLGIVSRGKTFLLNGAGVNLEEFSFVEYPSQSEVTKFLFMGRIMAEKGVNELFDACHKLYENGYKFNLDVLGSYEEDYKEIIDNYINEGWLKFHGYQNDVRPFIRDCNCFVLPSWHEGMANTNLECASMGRPIITSNIHGCLEAVIDGKTGYLVEKKNVNDLYKKLKQFIELPYDKKVEMGQASHNHIAKNFDKKIVVDETIKRLF
ncbi:glycosyltransferase family 4 protein [uncultured Eubacterium sp.]|uniref:glycosyltransferase family 4 protein n=1 Tax=uncultured Eubacterium sp. TaxID=165185 RepID=UPI0025F25266|nr:glycosyltransferase family 4 protein [uncultured Eubacterium sp.]